MCCRSSTGGWCRGERCSPTAHGVRRVVSEGDSDTVKWEPSHQRRALFEAEAGARDWMAYETSDEAIQQQIPGAGIQRFHGNLRAHGWHVPGLSRVREGCPRDDTEHRHTARSDGV